MVIDTPRPLPSIPAPARLRLQLDVTRAPQLRGGPADETSKGGRPDDRDVRLFYFLTRDSGAAEPGTDSRARHESLCRL